MTVIEEQALKHHKNNHSAFPAEESGHWDKEEGKKNICQHTHEEDSPAAWESSSALSASFAPRLRWSLQKSSQWLCYKHDPQKLGSTVYV